MTKARNSKQPVERDVDSKINITAGSVAAAPEGRASGRGKRVKGKELCEETENESCSQGR